MCRRSSLLPFQPGFRVMPRRYQSARASTSALLYTVLLSVSALTHPKHPLVALPLLRPMCCLVSLPPALQTCQPEHRLIISAFISRSVSFSVSAFSFLSVSARTRTNVLASTSPSVFSCFSAAFFGSVSARASSSASLFTLCSVSINVSGCFSVSARASTTA